MRKFATLIAFALLGAAAHGQLTRADFGNVGDSQVYRKADTTGVTAGPSGSGQNWNFGSLANTSVVATNQFIAPSAHAQGSNFPTANLCYKPFNDDFDFFEASVDSLYLVGEKSVANTRCSYTDGAALYVFPQAFGVANMDSVEGVYPDGFISSVTRKGWYQTVFDGDGQLTTPYQTYANVKRVEISAYFQDSSWTGAADGEVFLLRYEWYAAGETMPVLIVHDQQFILNGGNPTITREVWYADPNAVSTEDAAFGDLQLLPNPSHGQSQLRYSLPSNDDVRVEVLNVLGERVAMPFEGVQAAGRHELNLGTDRLAAGIYMVRLSSSQGSVSRKLVIN